MNTSASQFYRLAKLDKICVRQDIDLIGSLNDIPNSNLPGLRFVVHCICIITWHSHLNCMEILKGFELGTTLTKPIWHTESLIEKGHD